MNIIETVRRFGGSLPTSSASARNKSLCCAYGREEVVDYCKLLVSTFLNRGFLTAEASMFKLLGSTPKVTRLGFFGFCWCTFLWKHGELTAPGDDGT
jgi:hypothetical protein